MELEVCTSSKIRAFHKFHFTKAIPPSYTVSISFDVTKLLAGYFKKKMRKGGVLRQAKQNSYSANPFGSILTKVTSRPVVSVL